jgi:hypothetical protein
MNFPNVLRPAAGQPFHGGTATSCVRCRCAYLPRPRVLSRKAGRKGRADEIMRHAPLLVPPRNAIYSVASVCRYVGTLGTLGTYEVAG